MALTRSDIANVNSLIDCLPPGLDISQLLEIFISSGIKAPTDFFLSMYSAKTGTNLRLSGDVPNSDQSS